MEKFDMEYVFFDGANGSGKSTLIKNMRSLDEYQGSFLYAQSNALSITLCSNKHNFYNAQTFIRFMQALSPTKQLNSRVFSCSPPYPKAPPSR